MILRKETEIYFEISSYISYVLDIRMNDTP